MIIWGQEGVDNIQNISNIFLSQDVSVRLSHVHLASLPPWSSLGTCSPPICLVHCIRSSTLFLQCLSVHAPLERKPFLWLSKLFRTWAAQYLRCLSVGILPRALEESSLRQSERGAHEFLWKIDAGKWSYVFVFISLSSSHVTNLGCACCRETPQVLPASGGKLINGFLCVSTLCW